MTDNTPAVQDKAIRFTCGRCQISYPLGKETTMYLYNKQAWFNHFDTNCVKCHRDYTIWGIKQAVVVLMMQYNKRPNDLLIWVISDYCDDTRVIREFCEDNHKNLPPDLWLSPRRQQRIDTEVAWFAYLLEHGESIE